MAHDCIVGAGKRCLTLERPGLGTFYPEVLRNGIMRFVLRLLIVNELCHLWARKTGCSTGIVFPPEATAKPRIRERVRQPTPSNRVIEVGFDTKETLGLS